MDLIYPGGLPIALSLVGYNSLFLGLFILLKRRDYAGTVYFFLNLFTFGWALGLSIMFGHDITAERAAVWGRFSYGSLLFVPAVWLHFVLSYTGRLREYLYEILITYAVTFLFSCFVAARIFILGFREAVNLRFYALPGPAMDGMLILFMTVTLYGFWRLFRASVEEPNESKRGDYRFLLGSQAYGYILIALTFLPAYGVALPQISLLILPLWQLLLAYAMVRYHLLDVEEIARLAYRDRLQMIASVAASINHEIRNPLYIIRGVIESYKGNLEENTYPNKDEMVQDANKVMDKAYRQALRAMDMMKRIALFVNRQTNEKMDHEPLDVKQVFDNLMPLVRHELAFEKVELIEDFAADLPKINANLRDVEGILFNLINNASQVMQDGGIIEVRAAAAEDCRVQIRVQDNGPGINPRDRERIFKPFFTTKQEGTGLGLYITKTMVERNGGRIDLESAEGQGTVFILDFPAYAVSQNNEKTSDAPQ